MLTSSTNCFWLKKKKNVDTLLMSSAISFDLAKAKIDRVQVSNLGLEFESLGMFSCNWFVALKSEKMHFYCQNPEHC